MVRKGSTVRVRQRALLNRLWGPGFLGGYRLGVSDRLFGTFGSLAGHCHPSGRPIVSVVVRRGELRPGRVAAVPEGLLMVSGVFLALRCRDWDCRLIRARGRLAALSRCRPHEPDEKLAREAQPWPGTMSLVRAQIPWLTRTHGRSDRQCGPARGCLNEPMRQPAREPLADKH